MFGDVDEELRPFIPDYRINLLAPREITDFTGFRTSIRQLFEVLKNATSSVRSLTRVLGSTFAASRIRSALALPIP